MRMDKDTRKALLAKYLEAETTLREEAMLREWYAEHPAEEDELELAQLIAMSAPGHDSLAESDEAVAAFDRMVAEGERPRKRKIYFWITGIAAAAALAALVLLLKPRPAATPLLTPVQIAEGIQQMMLLEIGDIESIVATPSGDRAILTAHLRDGSTCSYILSYNGEQGTASLLACQVNP